MLLPTMPLFIKELGGLDVHVGLAAGAFTIAAVIVRPFAGGLLDQRGRRPFLLAGLALFAVSMHLYGWAGGVGALLIVRVVHGVAWAFATTAAAAAVADIVPASRRGEGMGWHGLAMTLAMAVGPAFGVWTLEGSSFQGVFAVAVGVSLASLLAAALARMKFQRTVERRRIEIYDPSTLPVSAAVGFLAFAYGAVSTFLPLFAVTIDVNPGVYYFVYAVALTAARPIAGKLSDRHGEAAVIMPAKALAAVALVALSAANGLAGVIAAAILFGVGFGSAQPALQAALLNLVPRERFGVANASFFTAFDLGIALGATILGWVSEWLGHRAIFAGGAVSVALSLAVFAAFARPLLRRAREGALQARR